VASAECSVSHDVLRWHEALNGLASKKNRSSSRAGAAMGARELQNTSSNSGCTRYTPKAHNTAEPRVVQPQVAREMQSRMTEPQDLVTVASSRAEAPVV
jgi:hypothetical protein